MTNEQIITSLSEVLFSNPNAFYDRAITLARMSYKTKQDVIDIYNDYLDSEYGEDEDN